MPATDSPEVRKLTVRTATVDDLVLLNKIAARAVNELVTHGYYTSDQICAAGDAKVYAIDPDLIAAGTYYVVEVDGVVAGGSGWSPSGRLHHGADGPSSDSGAAAMRATYVEPPWTRRGLAALLIQTTEAAARLAGFRVFEAMCTPMSAAMRRAAGYEMVRSTQLSCARGLALELAIMRKTRV